MPQTQDDMHLMEDSDDDDIEYSDDDDEDEAADDQDEGDVDMEADSQESASGAEGQLVWPDMPRMILVVNGQLHLVQIWMRNQILMTMPTSPSTKTRTISWTWTTCQISPLHPPSQHPNPRTRSLIPETSENEAMTRRRSARRRESSLLLPVPKTMRHSSTMDPRKICRRLCIRCTLYIVFIQYFSVERREV